MFFNSPSDFNDPFDSKVNAIWKGTEEEWHDFLIVTGMNNPIERELLIKEAIREGFLIKEKNKLLLKTSRKKTEIFNEKSIFASTADFFRVCCFTLNKSSILMWSHYADNHQGICLCFRFKQHEDEKTFILDSEPHFLYPVKYIDDMPPQINLVDWSKAEEFVDFLCTKHSDWKYENEYRLIQWPETLSSNYKMKYRKEDLEGIIFGLKTSIEDMKKINTIIKSTYTQEGFKVNFYQAREIPGKYALKMKKIDCLDKHIKKYSQ